MNAHDHDAFRKVFKEATLQKKLEQDGFAVFDFLTPEEVATYLDHIRKMGNLLNYRNGLHITGECEDLDIKTLIGEFVCNNAQAAFQRDFEYFKVFQGSYIIKQPYSSTNKVYPHQDWSFVDELKGEASYTLWCALSTIEQGMGCIEVIRGSHRDETNIRYTPDEAYHSKEEHRLCMDESLFEMIPLKPGQAVIWDHRLIHRSEPNSSSRERVNVAFAMTHQDCTLKLWWQDPHSEDILEFNVDDDFYKRNNSGTLLYCFNNKVMPAENVYRRHAKQQLIMSSEQSKAV